MDADLSMSPADDEPPLPLEGLTRDDPRYWDARLEDHSGDGLYREGPHEARASWTRDAGSADAPAVVAPPAVARARQALAEQRARAALERAAEAKAAAQGRAPARPTSVRKLLAALRGSDLRG